MTTVTDRPQYLNANTNVYTAWDLRRTMEGRGAGVHGYEDFRVMERQNGTNMSVDVGKTGAGLMLAWVRGGDRGGQGLYSVDNIDRTAPTTDTYVAQLNEIVTSNASGYPRLDQVVLEVLDEQHAGASNLAQIRVLAGTPTAGATLDNRTGAASLPNNALLLADVIVADSVTSIDDVDIRDRRAFPLQGTVAPLLEDIDSVTLQPAPGLPLHDSTSGYGARISYANHDEKQAAYLAYLPRRIVGATRIRWKYTQGSPSRVSGDYNIAIYDASGRKVVETGVIAWVTALGGVTVNFQERVETITATTFEPGHYYVAIGIDTSAGSPREQSESS